jgi:hypothetical protein
MRGSKTLGDQTPKPSARVVFGLAVWLEQKKPKRKETTHYDNSNDRKRHKERKGRST